MILFVVIFDLAADECRPNRPRRIASSRKNERRNTASSRHLSNGESRTCGARLGDPRNPLIFCDDQDSGSGKRLRSIGVGASSLEEELAMKSLVSAILLSSAIGGGTVLAQTSALAPTGQPARSHMSAEQKSAISKSCSDQANAKGLHGKARWKFRSACKKAGGKAE
jgi:hypothetical protein